MGSFRFLAGSHLGFFISKWRMLLRGPVNRDCSVTLKEIVIFLACSVRHLHGDFLWAMVDNGSLTLSFDGHLPPPPFQLSLVSHDKRTGPFYLLK